MLSPRRAVLACLVVALTMSAPGPVEAAEVVVRFRAGVGPGEEAAVRASVDGTLEERLSVPRVQVVELAPGVAAGDAARALETRPEVVYAAPNRRLELAATDRFGDLWGLENTGQLGGAADADIDVTDAWAITRGSDQVVVAVVDTGVEPRHPDLAGRLVAGQDLVDEGTAPDDEDGHGTHVAGTIGARGDDELGVVGVSPEVAIMPLRACAETCADADVAEAFDWAGDHGARIVNASLGGPGHSRLLEEVVRDHPDVLFVFAAGNDGEDVDTSLWAPCTIDAPNVVCVAASNDRDGLADFSNRGARRVHLAAPGVNVLSTAAAHVVFEDAFETPALRWPVGPAAGWMQSRNGWDGQHSVAASPAPGQDVALALRQPLDLTAARSCHLAGWLDVRGGLGWDMAAGAGPWTEVARFGATGGWAFADEKIPAGLAGAASAGLRLHAYGPGDAFVDDLSLRCIGPAPDHDDHEWMQGTSMAAPHVAGAAALLAAHRPSAGATTLRGALLEGVDPRPGLPVATGRRLNAAGALRALGTATGPRPLPTPDGPASPAPTRAPAADPEPAPAPAAPPAAPAATAAPPSTATAPGPELAAAGRPTAAPAVRTAAERLVAAIAAAELRPTSRVTLRAPAPGRVTVSARRGRTLLLRGTRAFARAGTGAVALRLTAAGRRALRRGRTVTATTTVTFAPTTGAEVTVTRRVRLSGRPGRA